MASHTRVTSSVHWNWICGFGMILEYFHLVMWMGIDLHSIKDAWNGMEWNGIWVVRNWVGMWPGSNCTGTAIEVTAWKSDFISPCYLTWTAAYIGPACVLHALYIIARPESQFLCCTRVLFVWYSVAWGSVTSWWQSCMQLVHVLHVYSLRLALQCHTFMQYYLVYKLPSLISDLHTAAPMASEALEQEFGYTCCCLVR